MKRHFKDFGQINWPDQCAVCGDVAQKKLAVDSSAVNGIVNLGVAVAVESKVTRIWHPVCARHYRKAWLASGLSQRSLLWLTLGVLTSLPLLSILFAMFHVVSNGMTERFAPASLLLLATPSALYWSGFIWARKNTAVRISSAKSLELKFIFSSATYAKAFAKLNALAENGNEGDHIATIQFVSAKEEMNRVAEQGDLAFQANLSKASNPYRNPQNSSDSLFANYWDRGYEVAEKRKQLQKR